MKKFYHYIVMYVSGKLVFKKEEVTLIKETSTHYIFEDSPYPFKLAKELLNSLLKNNQSMYSDDPNREYNFLSNVLAHKTITHSAAQESYRRSCNWLKFLQVEREKYEKKLFKGEETLMCSSEKLLELLNLKVGDEIMIDPSDWTDDCDPRYLEEVFTLKYDPDALYSKYFFKGKDPGMYFPLIKLIDSPFIVMKREK